MRKYFYLLVATTLSLFAISYAFGQASDPKPHPTTGLGPEAMGDTDSKISGDLWLLLDQKGSFGPGATAHKVPNKDLTTVFGLDAMAGDSELYVVATVDPGT